MGHNYLERRLRMFLLHILLLYFLLETFLLLAKTSRIPTSSFSMPTVALTNVCETNAISFHVSHDDSNCGGGEATEWSCRFDGNHLQYGSMKTLFRSLPTCLRKCSVTENVCRKNIHLERIRKQYSAKKSNAGI